MPFPPPQMDPCRPSAQGGRKSTSLRARQGRDHQLGNWIPTAMDRWWTGMRGRRWLANWWKQRLHTAGPDQPQSPRCVRGAEGGGSRLSPRPAGPGCRGPRSPHRWPDRDGAAHLMARYPARRGSDPGCRGWSRPGGSHACT